MSYFDNPSSVLDLVTDNEAHRDVYIDEDVYELEIKHLFRNTWIYVGHASQIPNKGDFYTTTIADQPVLMVRHTDNEIHVLYNRCAHRGTKLVTDFHGNTGKTFRCPYHAWTYRTDGTLLGVPVRDGYEDVSFEKSCASKGITAVSNICVYREFVFAKLQEGHRKDGLKL